MAKVLAMSTACALDLMAVDRVIHKSQVDIVVLGLAANPQASGGNAGEDDPHKLSERGRIERLDTFRCTAVGVLRINTIPGY